MLTSYLKEKKEKIEKMLNEKLALYNYPNHLSEAMHYSVMNGGKRLRPIIMFMIYELYQEKEEQIFDVAIALEFIHCYSLVHDDLPGMDNDTYRRGKLTTHKKYDEATAILVGDALLTEAFNIIASITHISAEKKILLIKKLSEYAGFNGMIGGQFVDMESENKKISPETLSYIHSHKTGKLLKASIELPLIVLGITNDEYDKLVKYSDYIGIAYQIKDDLLDIEGDFSVTGKESTDIINDKTTYPSLYGIEKSKELLLEYTKKAKMILEDFSHASLLLQLTNYLSARGG